MKYIVPYLPWYRGTIKEYEGMCVNKKLFPPFLNGFRIMALTVDGNSDHKVLV